MDPESFEATSCGFAGKDETGRIYTSSEGIEMVEISSQRGAVVPHTVQIAMRK